MTNRDGFKSGVSRHQPSFLPARIEDYVDRNNPVRAIDAYGDAVDLARTRFRHPGSCGGRGQPPYDPRDLLKLYVYGYLHRIRSSRRLEQETCRNLELIWLLKGLEPGYRTIGNFRKENWAALKAACREFVLVLRDLGLVGGECVAIDGAFFDGNASKASIATRKKLAERLAALDRDIEAYGAALDANDVAEATDSAAERDGAGGAGEDIAQKVAAQMETSYAPATQRQFRPGDAGFDLFPRDSGFELPKPVRNGAEVRGPVQVRLIVLIHLQPAVLGGFPEIYRHLKIRGPGLQLLHPKGQAV